MIADAREYKSLEEIFYQFEESFSREFVYNLPANRLDYSIDFAIYSSSFVLYDQGLTMPLSATLLNRMSERGLILGWGLEADMVSNVSKRGLAVMASDFTRNVPLFMNVPAPAAAAGGGGGGRGDMKRLISSSNQRKSCPEKHMVAFYMTDGDNIAFDLGNFVDPAKDWWRSPSRGQVPIAWSLQPMLQEVHPYFIAWLMSNVTSNDTFIAGPSGI